MHSYSQIKRNLDQIIEYSLDKKVFSGCSLGFFVESEKKTQRNVFNYGFTNGEKDCSIADSSIYDLASLTKPFVTALSIFELLDSGLLNLEDSLGIFFKETPVDKENINILSLLNHCSGLPAHRLYVEKLQDYPLEERGNILVRNILNEKLEYIPNSYTIYSDLGYILLGKIIEHVSGKKLDQYWKDTFSIPLKVENELFFRRNDISDSSAFVETGSCSWSNKRLCGVVNDDNCRVLHGVAGHAGLFGTARAVLTLCEHIAAKYRGQAFPVENIKLYNHSEIKPGSWFYGFDTPSGAFSSSGKYFSKQTIGHLGFTGTSFWLDLARGIGVVFLTNRVLLSEKTISIKKLRPKVHDIVMKGLIEKA